MPRPGLKNRVLQIDELSAKGGLRGALFDDVIHYLRHHPEEAERVIQKLTPHLPGLGLKSFGQLIANIMLVRKDMLDQLPELVPPGERAVDYLNKIAKSEDQVQAYFLCRKRLEVIGTAQQQYQFDQISARRALIRAMALPLKTDLLEAMLSMPDGVNHNVRVHDFVSDWIGGMVAQVCVQPANETRTAYILEIMFNHGVEIQHPGHPCQALVYLAQHDDPGNVVNRSELAKNLLSLGANWKGAGLEDTSLWPRIKNHPRIRAQMLEDISNSVRQQQATVKPSRPSM